MRGGWGSECSGCGEGGRGGGGGEGEGLGEGRSVGLTTVVWGGEGLLMSCIAVVIRPQIGWVVGGGNISIRAEDYRRGWRRH